MTAKTGNRAARKEVAALVLAVGRTLKAAAAGAQVGERTLRYWLDEEAFRARVRQLRSEVFARAVSVLCAVSGRASRTLGKLLRSKDERVQLGAAKAILEAAPRLREVTELETRLQALEGRLTASEGDKSSCHAPDCNAWPVPKLPPIHPWKYQSPKGPPRRPRTRANWPQRLSVRSAAWSRLIWNWASYL